ncbi:hypothetical protein C0J52_25836 [Blattella germanica]|nr:hypothetical protein C0J52_25836 [Blattella germanica]
MESNQNSSPGGLLSASRYTLRDRKRNEDARKELGIFNLLEEIKKYRRNWREHIERMEDSRTPKAMLKYKPKGRRDVGRLRKRWGGTKKYEGGINQCGLYLEDNDDNRLLNSLVYLKEKGEISLLFIYSRCQVNHHYAETVTQCSYLHLPSHTGEKTNIAHVRKRCLHDSKLFHVNPVLECLSQGKGFPRIPSIRHLHQLLSCQVDIKRQHGEKTSNGCRNGVYENTADAV